MFEKAHTETWRDIHASAMHEACTHHHTQQHTYSSPAAFNQKMRGMAHRLPADLPLTEQHWNLLSVANGYVTVSSRIPVSFLKFNYHLMPFCY